MNEAPKREPLIIPKGPMGEGAPAPRRGGGGGAPGGAAQRDVGQQPAKAHGVDQAVRGEAPQQQPDAARTALQELQGQNEDEQPHQHGQRLADAAGGGAGARGGGGPPPPPRRGPFVFSATG